MKMRRCCWRCCCRCRTVRTRKGFYSCCHVSMLVDALKRLKNVINFNNALGWAIGKVVLTQQIPCYSEEMNPTDESGIRKECHVISSRLLYWTTFNLLQVERRLLSSPTHTLCGHLHPYRVFLAWRNNIINIQATLPWSLPWFLRIGQIVAWPFVRFHHFLINAHANYIITHTTRAHDTTLCAMTAARSVRCLREMLAINFSIKLHGLRCPPAPGRHRPHTHIHTREETQLTCPIYWS